MSERRLRNNPAAASPRHNAAWKPRGTLRWALSIALALLSNVATAQSVPRYQGPVNDNAQMLPEASRAFLTHLLNEYNAKSGHHFAFLSVDSLEGNTLEAYTLKVAETWKLGRAREDDGLLLLVAKDARKVRIEVGYGLEGVIPDVIANRVIDEVLTPAFRRDQFAWGLVNGFKTLMLQGESTTIADTTSDPVAKLLGIEAPAIKSYVNDYAHKLNASDAERFNTNLGQLAGRYGMTFVLLTMHCPAQLELEHCRDAVQELWAKRLAYYDGLVAWFDYTRSSSNPSDSLAVSARLTLDRLARLPQQAWVSGTFDHAQLEAAVRELVERAGLSWAGEQPPTAVPVSNRASPAFSQSIVAQQHPRRPDTFQDKVVFGLVASVLLGVLILLAYAIYRSRHSIGVRTSAREPDNTPELRDSVTSFSGGGDGWNASTSGDSSSSGDTGEGGRGGTFGGGGASGDW